MRGLSRAVLLGALAAAVAVNLPAQRGGGGHAGGGFGGGGHVGGGFSGGPGRVAAQSVPLPSATALGAGALRFGPSSTARSIQAARGFIGPNGRVTRLTRGHAFRGYGAPFAYWLSPWYFPFDYTDPSSAGPDDTGYDPNAEAAMMAQNDLAEQVRRLSAQVAQLQSGLQPPPPPDAAQQENQPPPVPVTLILHDGQQLQVQNFAVMNQTFWDFTRQPVRKIPISSIDIAASTKATQANGGEFPQLATQ